MLEVPVVAGREFSYDISTDSIYWLNPDRTNRFIINETAAREFGIEDPVGAEIMINGSTFRDRKIEIIGVVKDFHFKPMNLAIQPVMFWYLPGFKSKILIKANPGKLQEAIKYTKEVLSELSGSSDIPVTFVKDEYYKDLKVEEQLGKLFIWFAMISIIIGALGLYGISTNAIQRRIKEIGIRKAHGATAGSILGMLQLYFSKIVLISGLIAIPVSYYLLTRWLNGYPYKTDLSWLIFFGSLVFAVVIALATISYRTWKAANSNPVDALRYE